MEREEGRHVRWLLVVVVALHGLIHLLGVTKAFGLAELATPSAPISRPMGVLWGVGALVLLAAAVIIAVGPRTPALAQASWAVALIGAVVSQALIVSAWADARFGTVVNVVLAVYGVVGAMVLAPIGLRARYRDEARALIERGRPGEVLTTADLAAVPADVARYLEVSGAIGRPRPATFRARWRGRIRSAEDAAWMALEAEQVNGISPGARWFWMDASMMSLPIIGLHAFAGGEATMQVRALGMVPVADARGPEMTRAETVTLFNDLCMLAPAALASPSIDWQPLGEHRVRATFTHGAHTVAAELSFGPDGMLADFVSDDRARESDGAFVPTRWSTPLRSPRDYDGGLRVSSRGEARWHRPDGTSFAYIELELVSLEHDPRE